MNNYEQYYSPLKLITQFGLDPERTSSATIKSKRKELLLQLQLESKQIITIDGVEYTKNDVLSSFDELNNQDGFEFHLKVVRIKDLSNFLLFHTLPEEKIDTNLELPFKTIDDQQKLSRFLAYAISKVMGKVIRNAAYQKLLNLGPILDLLRHIDYEFAFRKLITFNNDLHISTALPHIEGSQFEWDEFKHLDYRELYVLANYIDQGVVNFAQLDWNPNFALEYSHFSNTDNRTYWLIFEGHFNEFNEINLNLFKKRFQIPFAGTAIIRQENDTLCVEFKEG